MSECKEAELRTALHWRGMGFGNFSEERFSRASLRMCGRNVSLGPECVDVAQMRKGCQQGVPETVCVWGEQRIGSGEGAGPEALLLKAAEPPHGF